MAALGLPDPSDYSAPVNGPQGGAVNPPAPPPSDPPPIQGAPVDAEITPFPVDPPTVAGEMLTENVFQQGV